MRTQLAIPFAVIIDAAAAAATDSATTVTTAIPFTHPSQFTLLNDDAVLALRLFSG